MSCPIVTKTIDKLEAEGIYQHDTSRVLNKPAFIAYNDKWSQIAKEKFNLTNVDKMFNVVEGGLKKMLTGSSYLRDNKESITRAFVNQDFFNELQEKYDLANQPTDTTVNRLKLKNNNISNVKPGVEELFNSNPELANQVYEVLGFYPKNIIRDNQEYFNNPRIRFFVKIADEVRESLPKVKDGYTRLYRGNRPSDLKSNPQFTNSLEGIALPFLMSYEGQLSYIDTPTSDLSKYVQKGGVATNAEFIVTPEIAKSATPVDNSIVEKYKKQYPDKLVPLEITPQQKQQALQLYSQYLESLNKPNTNPILQGNQQEQVKKFAELQERLSNKEFLEGAKSAYESTPALQQYGTQEQYNDYIARVSLGIIKNPSSGEYNYESKVKDIVYHGTDALRGKSGIDIEGFKNYMKNNINTKGIKLNTDFDVDKLSNDLNLDKDCK